MHTKTSKLRLRPVIRLFVRSTFSDMKHERNALQERVFPNLERLCEESESSLKNSTSATTRPYSN